jgi:hypothetical protein
MSSFRIVRKENKIIVKIIEDPNLPSDILTFSKEYQSILEAQFLKTGTKPVLVILFDLRNVTLNVWNPKLALCLRVVEYFTAIADISGDTVIATSSLFPAGNTFMVNVIQQVLDTIPGHIPTFVSSEIDACKTFLKDMEKRGRIP